MLGKENLIQTNLIHVMMQRNEKLKTRQGSGAVEGSPKGGGEVTGGTTVRHGRCEVTGWISACRYQATDQEDLTSGFKKQKRDWAPHNRLVMECYYRSGASRREFGQ